VLNLRVRSITNEAVGINSYELVDPVGRELPSFTAGSHIDVHVPPSFVRQYSLCNDPRERHRYLIGVLKAEDGRGGSKAMHMNVRPGDLISVSPPRNNFPLAEEAKKHLMIAGGIGVTPMMAMIERLKTCDADFTMHYCSRSPDKTAFRDRLVELADRRRVIYHHDNGDPAKGVKLVDVLREYAPGTHLYYCGPAGLMEAANRASAHWPQGTVHFEYFAPPPSVWPQGAMKVTADEFQVKLARSGSVFTVPPGRSIIEVLREGGIECSTSCEAGVCGTCRTRYLEGTPEHHDFVLNESERGEYVMICCARSNSELLVLDL
jgi:ferredoxin-NADP reductase